MRELLPKIYKRHFARNAFRIRTVRARAGKLPRNSFRRFLKFKAVRLQSAPPAVAFIQILKPYIPKSFLHGLLLTLFNLFATSLSVKFSVPKKILLSLLTVCHFLPYQPESLIKSRPHFFWINVFGFPAQTKFLRLGNAPHFRDIVRYKPTFRKRTILRFNGFFPVSSYETLRLQTDVCRLPNPFASPFSLKGFAAPSRFAFLRFAPAIFFKDAVLENSLRTNLFRDRLRERPPAEPFKTPRPVNALGLFPYSYLYYITNFRLVNTFLKNF